MNKVSIDRFYDRHRGYINVVSSYLSEKRIPFILKSCRLRPYAALSQPLSPTPNLERWWVDEFGNSMVVGKNARLRIVYGDLSIERSLLGTTDLFAQVSLPDLFTISKFLYICAGTMPEELGNNPVYILSFLGHDNFFRTRLLSPDPEPISTLYLGYQLLKMIATFKNIRYFQKLTAKSIVPNLPLVNVRQWVSFLPAHEKLAQDIKSECPDATTIIGLEK